MRSASDHGSERRAKDDELAGSCWEIVKRTNYCGRLRASDADKEVVLMGWVHRRRDLGNLIFIDVRDRAGIAQVVFNKEQQPEAHAQGGRVALGICGGGGRQSARSGRKPNPEMATGEVEVFATRLHILNNAKTPPFQIEDDSERQRRDAAALSLSGFAAAAAAPQPRAAPPHDFWKSARRSTSWDSSKSKRRC